MDPLDITTILESLMAQAPGTVILAVLILRRLALLERVVIRLDRRLDHHGIPDVPSDPPSPPSAAAVPHG